MAIILSVIAELSSVDMGDLIMFALILVCLLIVLAVVLIVALGDGERVRIDPHAVASGDIPGFSREQLERIARMPVPPTEAGPRR